ncbi:hypothetical protein BTVI_05052 [Pitangus sulphuratus]|nr:hypothetical protein BTVI_05052 [Pitangus sulphuratus]
MVTMIKAATNLHIINKDFLVVSITPVNDFVLDINVLPEQVVGTLGLDTCFVAIRCEFLTPGLIALLVFDELMTLYQCHLPEWEKDNTRVAQLFQGVEVDKSTLTASTDSIGPF